MAINKLDELLNELIENAQIFDMPVTEYLKKYELADEAILQLEKSELIKLFTKAMIAITVMQSEHCEHLRWSEDITISSYEAHKKTIEESLDLAKAFEVQNSTIPILLKQMRLVSEKSGKLALSKNARTAAKIRLKNDCKQLALKEIEGHFKASTYPFDKRGYTAQFVREMESKYPIIKSYKTIEKLVAKLKKNTPLAS